MLTKGAIGNLINRYRAVLKKCHLINTFGSLAVASMLVMGGAGVAEASNPLYIGATTGGGGTGSSSNAYKVIADSVSFSVTFPDAGGDNVPVSVEGAKNPNANKEVYIVEDGGIRTAGE